MSFNELIICYHCCVVITVFTKVKLDGKDSLL